MKTCRECGETKPATQKFWIPSYKSKSADWLNKCRDCTNARRRELKNAIPMAKLSEEGKARRRAKRDKYRINYTKVRIERWHAEHGPDLPFCLCGCGQKVTFDSQGIMPRYIFGHHMGETERAELATKMREMHAGQIEDGTRIQIDKFRAACYKIKEEKGWTWKVMAFEGGISENHLHHLIHSKKPLSVRYDWAWAFFRRIAGLPAPASTFQKRERAADLRADHGMMKEDCSDEEQEEYRMKRRVKYIREKAQEREQAHE